MHEKMQQANKKYKIEGMKKNLQKIKYTYLTNECENKIVDGDISIQCKRKANEEYQMM